MNVIILTSTFLPKVGGAEIAIAELSNSLSNLRANVTIIAPEKNKEVQIYNIKLSNNIQVKRIKISIFPFISMIKALIKFGRNADIIHAHFLYPSGFSGLIYGYLTHKHCIVTMHGADIQMDKSIGYGIRLDWRLDIIIKYVLRNVYKLIAPSKRVLEEAVKAGADPRRICIIPHGVKISKFNPNIKTDIIRKKLSIKSDDKIILTMANFRIVKGYQFLVKAIPKVIKEYPEAKFIFCGRGPEKEKIVKMVNSLGISENVIFAGFIGEDEKPMYYSMADIFVHPSLLESAGIVFLEALVSGKPLVASDVGNVSELIKEGISGILVNPKDPIQLSEAIVKYLKNPLLRERGGRVGREHIIKNYSWDVIAKKTLSLYEECIYNHASMN